MARIFISATHKSSGKTTVSIGLCAALRAQGSIVQPFKKGPDYIDPLWLGAASGRACHNLDFNTMTPDEIIQTVQRYSLNTDIALIEANKGLYDGMALDGSDSNAAIAKLTRSPVVLVVDTRGMTRGIAPLLLGYQAFDRDINIAGIIFNRVGGARHAAKLRESVEYHT
ncbi:MAG: AAA family ATPase, partial [Thiothrix litoralis]